MPINPAIPLSVQPPKQSRSPISTFRELSQLKNVQRQGKIQEMQIDQLERQKQGNEIFAQGGTDQEFLDRLQGAGLQDQWLIFQEHVGKMDLNQLQQNKAHMTVVNAELEGMGKLVDQVMQLPEEARPAGWERVKRIATENRFSIAGKLSDQWDPNSAAMFRDFEAESKRVGIELDNQLKRLDVTGKEGEIAGEGEDRWLSLIGKNLGSAKDAKQWKAGQTFLRTRGIPPEYLAGIPKQFSQEAARRARDMAVDPGKFIASPRAPVTGTDVPLPPDVEAQRTRMNQPTLTPNASITAVRQLAGDWQKATGDVQELYRANTIMDAGMEAARAGDLNAGSQAILITFQKFLDPTSVVRESEYARSSEGLAMGDRVRGFIDRLQYGGAGVPVEELEAFAKLAREINGRLTSDVDSLLAAERGRIERVADQYNIPKDQIFPAYDYGSVPGQSAGPAGSNRMTSTNPQTGERMESIDGGKTWRKTPNN